MAVWLVWTTKICYNLIIMKKILFVVIIVIVAGVAWRMNSTPSSDNSSVIPKETETVSVPSSQTVKVSEKLSEYKNDELGFSVKYPTTWEKLESSSNVTFVIPLGSDKEKNTVSKIETKIDVSSGSCAFPLVTTVKERNTLKVGDLSFNMISLSNTIQGRSFFNRMYSLQKDSICYYFTLGAITSSPSSKGYTGADAQKVGARNTAIIDSIDNQFKDMVKSFAFVVGPAGQDESKVSPKK